MLPSITKTTVENKLPPAKSTDDRCLAASVVRKERSSVLFLEFLYDSHIHFLFTGLCIHDMAKFHCGF